MVFLCVHDFMCDVILCLHKEGRGLFIFQVKKEGERRRKKEGNRREREGRDREERGKREREREGAGMIFLPATEVEQL